MIVGDSTWLKYTIGITCLTYPLVHDAWDDIVETLVTVLG
jgi:hypothetical protein